VTQGEERQRRVPAWVAFTVLRVLAFLVPLAIAWALGAGVLLAALIATIVGLCLSVIFLSRQRGAMSGELAALRRRPEKPRGPETGEDELVEDAAVDAAPDQNGNTNAAASPKP
jgi:hypothetical protein